MDELRLTGPLTKRLIAREPSTGDEKLYYVTETVFAKLRAFAQLNGDAAKKAKVLGRYLAASLNNGTAKAASMAPVSRLYH